MRRAALRRTAQELEDRLRQGSGRVEHVIERTRSQLNTVDRFVHRYRWSLMVGASTAGLVLGLRRRRRRHPPARAALPPADRGQPIYLVQAPPASGSRSLLRSVVGTAATMAFRQALQVVADHLASDGGGAEAPVSSERLRR